MPGNCSLNLLLFPFFICKLRAILPPSRAAGRIKWKSTCSIYNRCYDQLQVTLNVDLVQLLDIAGPLAVLLFFF